jgi:hypothetical protein
MRWTLLLVLTAPLFAQSFNLTGLWQDDVGGKYRIRQVGNTLAWLDDRAPAAINVFMGTIAGSTVTGQWVDLPGGNVQQSGTLTLRIESNDRLVKTASTVHYDGVVISRIGASQPPTTAGPCTLNHLDWSGARQTTGMLDGRDIQYQGWDGARWLARLDRARNTFLHAPNGDLAKAHTDNYMHYRDAAGQNKASPRLTECGAVAPPPPPPPAGPCTLNYLDWNGARQTAAMLDGRDIQYLGWDGARWLARLDRARNTFIHAPNGDLARAHTDNYMHYRDAAGQNKASPLLTQCGR